MTSKSISTKNEANQAESSSDEHPDSSNESKSKYIIV